MELPEIKYASFPRAANEFFGDHLDEQRIYEKHGGKEEFRSWVDALAEYIGPVVTVGNAAGYVGVSRAAVYKRLHGGKLTAFSFIFEDTGSGDSSTDMCVPLSELRRWRELRTSAIEELKRQIAEEEIEEELSPEEEEEREFMKAEEEAQRRLEEEWAEEQRREAEMMAFDDRLELGQIQYEREHPEKTGNKESKAEK